MKLIDTHTRFIVLLLLLQAVSACNIITSSDDGRSKSRKDLFQTRAAKPKSTVAANAYYYRTLGSFVKGATTQYDEVLKKAGHKSVNLVLLYNAKAPWIKMVDGVQQQTVSNEEFNAILEAYQLQITQHFAIDKKNKGLVLKPIAQLDDPIEPARLLSLVDHVLLVNIKEVPESEDAASFRN